MGSNAIDPLRLPAAAPEIPEAPTREDAPYVSSRLLVLFIGFCLVLALFAANIYRLTIIDGPDLASRSKNNFLKEEPLLAPRGRILDRRGEPLAINQPSFNIEMSRFHLSPKEIQATVDRVAQLLNRPPIRAKAKIVQDLYPSWERLSLLDRGPIGLAEVLPVLEQAYQLPGMIVTPQYKRYYPTGAVTGLVTGYVGAIGKKKQDEFVEKGYLPTEKVGMLGAELTFEDMLHGRNGVQLVERDAKGRPRSAPFILPGQAAKPGTSLTLTLDLRLQRLADALIEGWNGAIIAMDPRDGSILAMAARPGFDPNDLGGRRTPGVKHTTYNQITRATFAPGSTFKIVTASAGLLAGINPLDTITCDGSITLPGTGTRFYCDLRSGHGSQNLYEALTHSCNIFFYRWAQHVGADRMCATARAYGFGARTDFELCTPEQESPGKVASPGVDKIYLGSVLQMGIGQGNMIDVTPLQLARAYATLANGGTLYRPRILKAVHTSDGKKVEMNLEPVEQGKLPISAKQRAMILEGFWRVIHEEQGTGYAAKFKPEWRVAGKTGTAQTGRKNEKPNAWFVCFSPADGPELPEILVLALIEHSGHGAAMAAPLCRQMLAAYYGTPEPQIVPPPLPGARKTEEEDAGN